MDTQVSAPTNLMLTVLGLAPTVATYSLNGKVKEAKLAPIALYHLLPEEDRPSKILALCTDLAESETFPTLQGGFLGSQVETTPLSLGVNGTEFDNFLNALYKEIPVEQEVRLILDVTHGFRHLSFLCYIGALFLSALRPKLTLVGAYYGMLAREQPVQPFQDLSPLLELPTWFSALHEFQRAGSTRGLEECLARSLPADSVQTQVLKNVKLVGEAYRAAIPLELGEQVNNLLKRKREMGKGLEKFPGGQELVSRFVAEFAAFRLPGNGSFPDGWKGKFTLDEAELLRQGQLINLHLDQQSYPSALGLLREWIISWLMWSEDRCQGSEWLAQRQSIESRLGAFSQLEGNLAARLADEHKILELWKTLTDLRNSLHHHGMRKASYFKQSPVGLKHVKEWWKKLIQKEPLPKATLHLPASVGKVLINAMGTTPGSLYSALVLTKPDMAIVLTSCELQTKVTEAAVAAEFPADKVVCIAFSDAFAGAAEKDDRLSGTDETLALASEVVHCLTGGTTLTSFAAAELAERARSFNIVVETIGLVDRRDATVQKEDPYQLGELIKLERKKKRRR